MAPIQQPIQQWTADAQLNELIRRYYRGEAALWEAIRASIDDGLRARGIVTGAYHIRLRRIGETYLVTVDDAAGYARQE
jgi:hypothetical protein